MAAAASIAVFSPAGADGATPTPNAMHLAHESAFDALPVGLQAELQDSELAGALSTARITLDVATEHSQRQLPHFRDTVIARSAGKNFYEGSPTINTKATVFAAEVEWGTLRGSLLPKRVRVEGRYRSGRVHESDTTVISQRSTTATIALDGTHPLPGMFIQSSYVSDLTVEEVGGEFNVFGEVIRKSVGPAQLAFSLGAVAGFREQSWDVNHIANLTSAGARYARFGDRNAVHFIHEDIRVLYGGIGVAANADISLGLGFKTQLGIRAMGYVQDAHVTGNDCFSIAFRVGEVCDGRHHTFNNGFYYGRVSERSINVGGRVRLSGGLSKAVALGTVDATIYGRGFVDAFLNDPAIDNPTFDDRHPARVKYENTTGYGWSVGARLRF